MRLLLITILPLFLGDFSVRPTQGAKIFFMIPLITKSEKQLYTPLIDELSLRGHEVVVASIIKSQYKSKTVREIVPITFEEMAGDYFSDPVEMRRQLGRYFTLTVDFSFTYPACEKVFEHPEFRRIIETEKFDLVIKNMLWGQCFTGIIHKMGAPFIIVNTFPPGADPWDFTGARLPASFTPFVLGPAKGLGKMDIFERLENVLLEIHYRLFLLWDMNPKSEAIYRKYLGQDVPSIDEINYNVSLVFSNSHYSIHTPAPALPDLVEIAGIHCGPGKPLPKELEEFVSGGKHGFIYFSMGSMVNSKFFSKSIRHQILTVFSKLKQRVLWKFEEDLPDLPPNVRIGKWLPQRDILAHPNIRLFITHGGGLSVTEAIYHGVPLVAMPIFADQDGNVQRAMSRGLAVKLEALELSEKTLEAAVKEILNNPRYKEKALESQRYFKDQPQTPMERAIFWTEYVLRHKGTKHMQSSARQLNFVEYYLLDVLALLVSIFSILVLSLFLFVRRVYNLIFLPHGTTKTKSKSKKMQ